jgi:antitoxin CcdA
MPQDLLQEARALGLNLSTEAEAGIAHAIKKAKENQWKEENAEAIAAYNAWYDSREPLIKPIWMQD